MHWWVISAASAQHSTKAATIQHLSTVIYQLMLQKFKDYPSGFSHSAGSCIPAPHLCTTDNQCAVCLITADVESHTYIHRYKSLCCGNGRLFGDSGSREDTHTFHLDLIVTNSVLPVVCSKALWFRDTPGSRPCDSFHTISSCTVIVNRSHSSAASSSCSVV